MKRGDIVVVSAQGDYGKPRPALIIQENSFNDTHASLLACLLTSDIKDYPLFRIDLEPSENNGLKMHSQIMIDKIVTLPRGKISSPIGRIDDVTLMRVNRSLALFLGLAN